MDIASMLNEPARSASGSRVREQRPSLSSIQRGFTAPSYSLPTPSPEWMSPPDASDSRHERPRRAWDAGGYSLPLIPKTQSSYEANISARFPEDYPYPDRPFLHHSSSDDYHSRHMSTDSSAAWSPEVLTPLNNSRLDRSTPSVYEPREYISRDRSFINEPFNPRRPSRSKSYSEQFFDVATVGSKSLRHKLSDSRSSLSSYTSSTFSGGHSRLSSMSTVNSAHFPRSLSTDVPMLDDMMEHTPTPAFPQGVGSGRSPMVNSSSLPGHEPVSSPIPSQRSTKRKRSRQTENTSSSDHTSPLRISTEVSDLHQRVLEQAQSLGLEFGKRLVGKPDICLFIENCTSRENIRKAISHIFGRNKVCTRRIPERVWVSVCRKHYQRTRYRQGAAYAKTQVHFVFSQIVRLLFWSFGYEQDSQVNAERVTITSWTFSIRKGELNRLAREDEESQTPRWVLEHLGSGKTNEEIFEIALRLKSEIDNQILVDFPPIEFLPEVVELPSHTTSSSVISPVEEESSRAADMSSHNRASGPRTSSSDAAPNARPGEYQNEAFNNVSQHGVPSHGLHWDMAERVPLPNPYLPNRRPRVNIANNASTSFGHGLSSEPRGGMDRQATRMTRDGDGTISRNCQHSFLPTITEVEVNDATQTSESPDEASIATDPYPEGRGVFGSYFSHRRANSEPFITYQPPPRLSHPILRAQSSRGSTPTPTLNLRGGAAPQSPESGNFTDESFEFSTNPSASQSATTSPDRNAPPAAAPPAGPPYQTILWPFVNPQSNFLFQTRG